MELKLVIEVKASHEKSTRAVRLVFTEDDLLKWAKQYAQEAYSEGNEAIAVTVEAIIP